MYCYPSRVTAEILMGIDEWVDYIQTLHVREVDLSLERVRTVYNRLRPNGVEYKVITVAGTNGKGSTCELLASIYTAAGYCVAKYTSPHIERYNERFNVSRSDVSDDELLQVFERVEVARKSTRLTFFEFGTLVAIELFAVKQVDIAIMEVGLGGRLDAVNILDADLSVVTSISVDHTDWLGSTRNEIGLEKIAISRPQRPCILGFSDVPVDVMNYCSENNIVTFLKNVHFNCFENKELGGWQWKSEYQSYVDLPLPFNQNDIQLDNASSALMSIELMRHAMPVSEASIHLGLQQASINARCEIVSSNPTIVVDVAHNQASIERLKKFVNALSVSGKVYVLCGMLKDKQIKQNLLEIAGVVDEWNLVTISNDRGCSASDIQKVLRDEVFTDIAERNTKCIDGLNELIGSCSLKITCFDDVKTAYALIRPKLQVNDVLIVFGSFFIVNDIMSLLNK